MGRQACIREYHSPQNPPCRRFCRFLGWQAVPRLRRPLCPMLASTSTAVRGRQWLHPSCLMLESGMTWITAQQPSSRLMTATLSAYGRRCALIFTFSAPLSCDFCGVQRRFSVGLRTNRRFPTSSPVDAFQSVPCFACVPQTRPWKCVKCHCTDVIVSGDARSQTTFCPTCAASGAIS